MGDLPTERIISSINLNRILYLLEKEILEKDNRTMGYKFDSFSTSGPYDEDLMNDLKAWKNLRYISNQSEGSDYPFANIKLAKEGEEIYKTEMMNKQLETILGKRMLSEIKQRILQYLLMSENELYERVFLRWIKEHPEQAELFSKIAQS